ncbi:hypothetical protein [Candidatus Nesciobacter abundans]|uniref:Uncharacterized protein n=1 Tax=Candidatus Nesciobacter abundans TaxID=2601668 RepID=A0A5C0UG60_9PROT|nr:hypothetical protein [Candidatus Nesciobacter abundans]QEK39048.1 hypothetical protein FZC36_01185 [Candidatus Nesciobacter abundans]
MIEIKDLLKDRSEIISGDCSLLLNSNNIRNLEGALMHDSNSCSNKYQIKISGESDLPEIFLNGELLIKSPIRFFQFVNKEEKIMFNRKPAEGSILFSKRDQITKTNVLVEEDYRPGCDGKVNYKPLFNVFVKSISCDFKNLETRWAVVLDEK